MIAPAPTDVMRRTTWLVVAVLVGLLVATQSVAVLAVIALVMAFALLSAITPLATLMFLLVLAPLRVLIATEASPQLPLDIGQLALIAFIAAWVLHHIILRQSLPRLTWSPLFVPLGLFVVLTGLTAFNALSLAAWLREWLKWVQIIVVVAITLVLASGKRWQWLIAGLIVSGVANAIIGFYEFFGGSGALHLLINGRFFRAFGTFGQPNPFGGFMGLLAPLAIMAALAYSWRWWQQRRLEDMLHIALYGVAALILVGGIMVSWSRGSWLGFVMSVLVMMVAMPRRLMQGLALAGLVAVFVGGLWFAGLLPESIVARVSSSTEAFFAFEDMRGVDITPDNFPVAERLAHWQAALNMAAARPWLGVGLGNYEIAYPQYRLINWGEPLGHAHNYYLNMLAEAGLIGLLGYGKVWLVILWLTWRARSHPDILSRFVVIGLLGSWTYLAVHSLFDNLYVNNLFLHIGLMLGILSVLYNQVNQYIELRMA